MAFPAEFINATERLPSSGGMVSEHQSELGNPAIAEINSLALRAIIAMLAGRGGVIYFPPGRYYLGRLPQPFLRPPVTFVSADILIPEEITLRFGPGATVVPFNYGAIPTAPGATPNPARRVVSGRFDETLKVRVEVRGRIEAGVHGIFDAVFENMETTRIQSLLGTSLDDTLHEAGIVLLTGNAVRQVYPEWWGAAPPRNLDSSLPLPAAVVRRTTMAFQETIHVAHTRRGALWNPSAPPMAPIPIALSGEYRIDRELQIGERWRDAQRRVDIPSPSGPVADPEPYPGHPVNVAGFILRGLSAPNSDGTGAATIRAHANFQEDDLGAPFPHDPRRTPGSASLLGVRGVGGWLIENVTFDAAFQATRCLTVETPSGVAIQMIGVNGCTFENGLNELVHLGGELPAGVLVDPKTGTSAFERVSRHWSAGQDLLGLRMERCVFRTADPPGAAPMRHVGVVYRAANAILIEFANCAFSGPAAPMFHIYAGGVSFHRCAFDTRKVRPPNAPPEASPELSLEGLDIFVDFASFETITSPFLSFQPGICRLKDVVSQSPMLISTYRVFAYGNPAYAAIELIGVEHVPKVLANEPLPPAILWAGEPSRLLLMGCRFVRPMTFASPPANGVPRRFAEPVLIDLGAWLDPITDPTHMTDRGLGYLESVIQAWTGGTGVSNAATSRGHVVDLGTRVEPVERLVRVSASTRDRLDSFVTDARDHGYLLQMFEQYSTTMIGP